MEELIYFCVRIVCIGYLLYSVYSWRRRIETVCTLLYGKPCVKKEKKEAAGTESAVSDAEVMGSTRYVYLDENAGSQPAKTGFPGKSAFRSVLDVYKRQVSYFRDKNYGKEKRDIQGG